MMMKKKDEEEDDEEENNDNVERGKTQASMDAFPVILSFFFLFFPYRTLSRSQLAKKVAMVSPMLRNAAFPSFQLMLLSCCQAVQVAAKSCSCCGGVECQ
jgi:hypothetical protein